MFQFFENSNALDSLDEVHLWALHYVYLPRINASLDEFKSQWNHHGLKTTGHQSPLALWANAMIRATDESNVINWQTYGIDNDGLIPNIDSYNNVVVHESSLQLCEQQLPELQQRANPLADDGNNGIRHFYDTVNFLQRFF